MARRFRITGILEEIDDTEPPIEPEPPVEPVQPPPVEPPPESGPNAHYESVIASGGAHLLYCNSLRTQQEFDDMARHQAPERWSLEGNVATRHRWDTGTPLSNSSGYQMRKVHAPIGAATGHTCYSWQFELYLSEAWAKARDVIAPGWNGNTKFVRLDSKGDPRLHILNWDKCCPGGYLTAPVFRYDGWPSVVHHSRVESGSTLRLSSDGTLDFQPGPECANLYRDQPYDVSQHCDPVLLLRCGMWIRITGEWRATADGRRLFREWIADEETDPCELFGSEDCPGEGFDVRADDDSLNVIDEFVFSLHSSTPGTGATEPLDLWIRNLILYQDACVPLGGRPVR